MEDFTGGLTEMFDLAEKPPANLFDIMIKSVERQSLMSCSIDVSQLLMLPDSMQRYGVRLSVLPSALSIDSQ